MADTIRCGVCGESNPADMEFCQNCQSRLQPLTGPLRGENAAIQPGAAPTKKVTSELEPVLPRWLREARQQARDSADEQPAQADMDQKTRPIPQAQDLLAGLASQKQETDEETPEWVAKITGAETKKKTAGTESTNVKWVELADEEDTVAQPSEQPRPRPEPAPQKDELTDWFRRASASISPPSGNAAAGPPAMLEEGSEPAPVRRADVPDWLRKLDAEAGSNTASPPGAAAMDRDAPPANVPPWLKGVEQRSAETSESKPAVFGDDLPDWLGGSGSSVPEAPAATPEPAQHEAKVPDWISSLRSAAPGGQQVDEAATPALAPEQADSGPAHEASAFTEDAMTGGDVDAIFASMQMPDWLSDASPRADSTRDDLPPAAQDLRPISPAELPSWVQAMRPVESAMPDSSPDRVADQRGEDRGPLAGLSGVLPTIPGAAAPSSKPRLHSIKLEATEQEQAHAALLEKIVAAEIKPVPMMAAPMLTSQRGLRWAIAALLLISLGSIVSSRSQFLPLPAALPNESLQAIQAIEAVPAGAPVLVVFDYEPATVGEMEASAASLVDHLLLLQHPRLALLSTSPTGAALAERFISTTLAERAYQRGAQYVNLGYLPGGLAGVRDFAQDPATTMPLGADAIRVWGSSVLQGVTRLSDFASILVLTDSLESGRVWIEQTAPARGSGSLVIVSSAQAAPMLLPYIDSGQVNGMVAGLNGAAAAEQANGGLPGFIRRYWDAYSVGLYLAILCTAIGGLWNLWLGVQDRRAAQGG